jgi:ATP-binding cassette subfamily B (MDR/TAP) protein 1
MEAIGASQRTFQIIDRESPPLRGGTLIEKDKLEGRIEFKDVNFSYPSRMDIKVLQDFSLNIKANTTVALVGQSGGGKSTIISLLERFYDVTSGSISIDGI